DVKLKDGSLAKGKKIMIDGQQRITALKAALLGSYVIDKEYEKVRIKIAFNPVEEKFDVQSAAMLKDKRWIPDISEVVNSSSMLKVVKKYLLENPEADEERIEKAITDLVDISKKTIGIIELASDLDIDTVTEIFIRINSQGVVLSQADFAMSKIAANETYGGNQLRKAIDYFCRLSTAPEFYEHIRDNDSAFANSDYFQKMKWLKDEKEDLYDPSYNDMLRVAFTKEFGRGKFADLVNLLSGRNFETRTFEESIAQEAYEKLRKGVLHFMNETEFKRFLMIIKSAGFIVPEMIRSQNALNMAYVIYLYLREDDVPASEIGRLVSRWFVYSVLTGRYSGSAESMFDFDIKQIYSRDFKSYLQEKEFGELSDAFWDFELVQRLNTPVISSPFYNIYLAAQVKNNDKGFLSRDITVANLIAYRGDDHHIFPKRYLKGNDLNRTQFNQIANLVYMQQEINIKIGHRSPDVYFKELLEQCNGGPKKYGAIDNTDELYDNLERHCIPRDIFYMNIEHYNDFLRKRRALMAQKIKRYYQGL
ncbi:MAG TPA: DUF262 domain-containing protein, partial [Chryseosolibacter sp.]|nr:DUF262 domain-containing protein [Chryseosolibacter sp.]